MVNKNRSGTVSHVGKDKKLKVDPPGFWGQSIYIFGKGSFSLMCVPVIIRTELLAGTVRSNYY